VLALEAIRISGTLDDPAATDGVYRSSDAADAFPVYRITGSILSAHDFQADMGGGPRHAGTDVLLAVGGERVLAQIPGSASALELGDRVTVRGEVSVVADYEWDAFELPDTRRQWSVEDVRNLDAGEYLLLLRPSD
jgi:hypothetical protein